MRLGSSRGWLECDVVSEGFELGDEALGVAFGVALEVVAAEVVVGLAGAEHVPVGDQHRVFDGAERAAVGDAGLEALVLGGEVAAFAADRRQGGFFERDAEPFGALAGAPGAAFAGELVVAGQRPAQLARCPAVGNTLMSMPISATMTSAVRRATP